LRLKYPTAINRGADSTPRRTQIQFIPLASFVKSSQKLGFLDIRSRALVHQVLSIGVSRGSSRDRALRSGFQIYLLEIGNIILYFIMTLLYFNTVDTVSGDGSR